MSRIAPLQTDNGCILLQFKVVFIDQCVLHMYLRWKKEFHELQSKYSPYQAQIDQLVSRIQGLQSQSDLAESEVCSYVPRCGWLRSCVTRVCLVVCASMSPLLAQQAVRMGKQFAQLVGHTNHRQKIQYVQKLTNENLSLKKVCTLHHSFLSTHSHLPSVRVCVYTLHGVSNHITVCMCACADGVSENITLCVCVGGHAP